MAPLAVEVTKGSEKTGLVEVSIRDNEWERREFWLHIRAKGFSVGSLEGIDEGCPMTLEGLNALIAMLTLARAEAAERGMFDRRPTPKSIREVADVLEAEATQ